jgi:TPR repeat protein
MDKSAAAHYFKLSADQGHADAQSFYGCCLSNGDGVSMDKSAAAHYFKLSADQWNAVYFFASGNQAIVGRIG